MVVFDSYRFPRSDLVRRTTIMPNIQIEHYCWTPLGLSLHPTLHITRICFPTPAVRGTFCFQPGCIPIRAEQRDASNEYMHPYFGIIKVRFMYPNCLPQRYPVPFNSQCCRCFRYFHHVISDFFALSFYKTSRLATIQFDCIPMPLVLCIFILNTFPLSLFG